MKSKDPLEVLNWLDQSDKLVKVFGPELILEACYMLMITPETLGVEEYHAKDPLYTVFERLNKEPKLKTKFMPSSTGKSQSITITEHCYRVRSKYQADEHARIINYCCNKMFPWFHTFNWLIYGGSVDEIYLATNEIQKRYQDNLVLYVNLDDLVHQRWHMIEERNRNYIRDYYVSTEDYIEQMRLFNTSEVMQFKELFHGKEN